ncbi:site-2 protease family protein [Demequina lignilytica]|uniref:Peptidase M50 n=1 Tax=Demequina lignilytica TaxID=3051663 RepID=A0AB35MKL8_9MICO|nr:site-2 protease family protein [Demequina sp. SYSU T0a273]MDN4484341.1 peptidase M50 [Demequina sp. SYSU T0a273]
MASPRTRGIPLGRVLGARVVLAPSTLIMAVVLAALYGTTYSSDGFSSDGAILGLVVAVALFVSIFLHELAHAVAARGFKREVHEIVLTFFGGHTQFRASDPRPVEIGVIAASGPIANAVIGAVAMALAGTLDGLPGAVTRYIALLNFFLAGFNALPGTPLDGGRVVNAIVWGVSGDRWKGHRWAAQGGRIVAIATVLAALGIPLLLGSSPDLVAVIWAVFLFSVIWPAASAELRAASVLARRERVTAVAVSRTAVGVPYDATVEEARALAHAAGAAEVVVLAADGQPAGHFPVALTDEVPPEARPATSLVSVTMPLVRGAVIPADAVGEGLVEAVVPWVGKTDAVAVMGPDGPVGVALLDDVVRALQ